MITVQFDESNPLHRAFLRVLEILERKGQDYEANGDPLWDNYRWIADHVGLAPFQVADIDELKKLSRLRALEINGRTPAFETTEESYLDKAGHSMLAFALFLQWADRRQDRPPMATVAVQTGSIPVQTETVLTPSTTAITPGQPGFDAVSRGEQTDEYRDHNYSGE